MNEPTAPRRYGDEEVARILRRATEIQISDPASIPSSGMTLAELESVAVEAGIDPRHLRRAAMELEVGGEGDASVRSKLAGGPLVVELGTVVPGELSTVGFERVLSVIQQSARRHGQGSLLGRTLTWQGEDDRRSLMVVVSARDGETSVRIEERQHKDARELFGGMVGGVGVGAGVGLGSVVGVSVFASPLIGLVAVPAGTIGLAYLGARAIYRSRLESRRRALTDLLDRIVREASTAMAERLAELPTPERPTAIPGT